MSTESDRELLELAAKANGLPWKWVKCPAYKIEVPGLLYRDEAHEVDYYPGWNPLENDGDALRLSVKLGISIEADASIEVGCDSFGGEYETGVEAWNVDKDGHVTKAQELHKATDPDTATRRAIVRAAAEIARATHKEGA